MRQTVIGMQDETLRVVDTLEEFESLGPSWDQLAESVARPSPFLVHGWLAERWRRVGDAAVVVASRGQRIAGALPLAFGRRYRLRVGEFLAGPYAGLDVALAAGESVEIARSLLDQSRAAVNVLELFGLGEQSIFALGSPASVRLLRLSGAPALSMPDGWEAAYARLTSSKTRNLHRRRLKQFEQLGTVEFETARSGAELDTALEESFRLHELRWRSRPDADLSGYASEAGRAFHRAAAQRLAERDMVRLTLLRLDGRAIAFNYWLRYRDVMTVHRLAFDPAFAEHSPGLLATLHAIGDASTEGCTRVDFLRGEERYKLQLADKVEPVYWTAVGGPVATIRRAELRSRQLLKRSQMLHRLYDRGRKLT
jgi:CelD/BcsL family acetyltransferase involved in cellulose biosynthesis